MENSYQNKVRKLLLCLSLKFDGDTQKIFEFLNDKTPISEEEINETIKDFKGKFITFIDEEYPNCFKTAINPPAVLFYEGNLELLKKNNGTKFAIVNVNTDTGIEYKEEAYQILSCLKEEDTLIVMKNSEVEQEFYGKQNIIKIANFYDNEDIDHIKNNKKILVLSQSYELNDTIDRYHLVVNIADKGFVISACDWHIKALEELADKGKELFVIPTSIKHTKLINNALIYNGAWAVFDSKQFKLHLEQEQKQEQE